MAKVYRVTVTDHIGKTRVKHGTKRMASAMWGYYRSNFHECTRSGWDTSGMSFTVEVAPSAVFKDISASYVIE